MAKNKYILKLEYIKAKCYETNIVFMKVGMTDAISDIPVPVSLIIYIFL